MTEPIPGEVELVADLARFDEEGQRLVGGKCAGCGYETWPTRLACSRCGGLDIRQAELPRYGVIETWTRMWIPVEGIEPPYVLGQVRLGDVHVFGHVRGDMDDQHGGRAVVRIAAREHPKFWFDLVDES